VAPQRAKTVLPTVRGPLAETWVLWAAEVAVTPAGLRRARAELAEALVRAGWGPDAGRVLLVVGDAMARARRARQDEDERIDVAFLVGRGRAAVRITGRGRATAYPSLVDRIEQRPARGASRVLMRFRREGLTRRGPRPPR